MSAVVAQPEGSQPQSARGRPSRGNRRGRGRGASDDAPNRSESTNGPRPNRGRGRKQDGAPMERGSASQPTPPRDDPPHRGRRHHFRAQLTTSADTPTPTGENSSRLGLSSESVESSRPATPQKRPQKSRTKLAVVDAPIPVAQDLTTRLTESMRKPPYADCPICFNEIHPMQPTWSCGISEETNRCCWTVFHNKCIVAWSRKNLQESRDAYRARNEDHEGEWRCPGCQTKRIAPPGPYRCFCGAVVDPKPGRLATPHSCGQSCQRQRATCAHPCPLNCHPGPCPPCVATVQTPCHCGKTISSMRCSHLTANTIQQSLSCGQPCGKQLTCGKHKCTQPCHPGPCTPCDVVETSKCYCGKEQRTLPCGEGDAIECASPLGEWIGRFTCQNLCERSYSCGKHACKEECHPHPLSSTTCPRDPSLVITCPCGKKQVDLLGPIRRSCVDTIPTCGAPCSKLHPTCDHPCMSACHLGPCPPCRVPITMPCRCGGTSRVIPCFEQLQAASTDNEFLCTKLCKNLRNCGRHTCNRVCCPLAHVKVAKGKGKKRLGALVDEEVDGSGWHECDLPCGKLLNCGLHRCERKDHKGLCPPCLQSSFDEMTCRCGRTTLMPPIPCGTQIHCGYPCDRPPPACGHPKTPHTCHEQGSCPPCPFLTSKLCACGKTSLPNIRCSQEKVSCGTVCGKLLNCGSHTCERLCHGGECGSCSSICGKDRKTCLPDHHPCTLPCHAPSACPETTPCTAIVNLKCPCGRIQRPVPCSKSVLQPNGLTNRGSLQPKCTNECLVAQRNARLAEAFGIANPEKGTEIGRERLKAVYPVEIHGFARANMGFLGIVEKALADFMISNKPTQVLPHMPESKRNFVHDLAQVYRIDTRMIDAEPQRSVELIRRMDTRIPAPLLSQTLQQQTSASSNPLGRLLLDPSRIGSTTPKPSTSSIAPPAPRSGWAAVASSSNTLSKPNAASPARPVITLPPPRSSANTPTVKPPSVPTLANPLSPQDVPSDWEDDA